MNRATFLRRALAAPAALLAAPLAAKAMEASEPPAEMPLYDLIEAHCGERPLLAHTVPLAQTGDAYKYILRVVFDDGECHQKAILIGSVSALVAPGQHPEQLAEQLAYSTRKRAIEISWDRLYDRVGETRYMQIRRKQHLQRVR